MGQDMARDVRLLCSFTAAVGGHPTGKRKNLRKNLESLSQIDMKKRLDR